MRMRIVFCVPGTQAEFFLRAAVSRDTRGCPIIFAPIHPAIRASSMWLSSSCDVFIRREKTTNDTDYGTTLFGRSW